MSSFRDDPIDAEIVGLVDALNSIQKPREIDARSSAWHRVHLA